MLAFQSRLFSYFVLGGVQVSIMTLVLEKLSNKRLVYLCAQYPRDEGAWSEFIRRFDQRIRLVVYRAFKEKASPRDMASIEEHVQDRVQEVYQKLLENQCRALNNYVGKNEDSIFLYLGTIAQHVVVNYFVREKATQKRPNISSTISPKHENQNFRELVQDPNYPSHIPEADDDLNLEDLEAEIESILNHYLRGRHKQRNLIIFKLYFYHEYKASEIVEALPYSLSLKTVENIISHLKKIVQDGLINRNVS